MARELIPYGDVDGFVAYCEAMGYALQAVSPTSPSDELKGALLRGSTYIDGRYRVQFPGKRAGGRSQVREWPRTGAYDAECNAIADDVVPDEVIEATYEAAFREEENPGSLTPDFVGTDVVTSEKVGSLAVTYANSSTTRACDAYPVVGTIDAILAPLLGAAPTNLFGTSTRI